MVAAQASAAVAPASSLAASTPTKPANVASGSLAGASSTIRPIGEIRSLRLAGARGPAEDDERGPGPLGLVGRHRDNRGRHLDDDDDPDLGQVAQGKVEVGTLERPRRLPQDRRVPNARSPQLEQPGVALPALVRDDADELHASTGDRSATSDLRRDRAAFPRARVIPAHDDHATQRRGPAVSAPARRGLFDEPGGADHRIDLRQRRCTARSRVGLVEDIE